jgi:hypothetical protein
MRDGLAAAAPCCAGCGKPLRPGAQFCPGCGRTAAGSAEKAAPLPPLIERRRPASVFDSHWREIKQVGWLFALLLASSLIAGLFGRFKPSPWLDVSVSAVDAFIVMAFAVIHYRDIRPLIGRPALDFHPAAGGRRTGGAVHSGGPVQRAPSHAHDVHQPFFHGAVLRLYAGSFEELVSQHDFARRVECLCAVRRIALRPWHHDVDRLTVSARGAEPLAGNEAAVAGQRLSPSGECFHRSTSPCRSTTYS